METENITIERRHQIGKDLLSLIVATYHSDLGYVKYKLTYCGASEMLRVEQYIKQGDEFFSQIPISSLPVKLIQFILKELNINDRENSN